MVKRAFDILVSLMGILLLLPLFLVVSTVIVLDSRGGVFYRGVRVGRHEEPFRILKFRTMQPHCEKKGYLNVGHDDRRITRVGRFLRSSKIDELPQLFNVLAGHMSMVGPRPELQYYVDMYTDQEKVILEMKPGITDWASLIYMEQDIDFARAEDPDAFYLKHIRPVKLRLQLYYHSHRGMLEDLLILVLSVHGVLTKEKRVPKRVARAAADGAHETKDAVYDKPDIGLQN